MRSIGVAAAALTLALLACGGPAQAQRAIAHPVLRPVADPEPTTSSRPPPPPHGSAATPDGHR